MFYLLGKISMLAWVDMTGGNTLEGLDRSIKSGLDRDEKEDSSVSEVDTERNAE